MEFKPHKYQEEAINKIIEIDRCGLFLDMGLGKTVITLTAINDLMFNRFEVNKVLIIAPLKVAEDTWIKELSKWDHLTNLSMSLVLGDKAKRIKALETQADIYVINRENVSWLVTYLGRDWDFDMVVIDELSSFKNPSASRFKSLKKVIGKSSRVVGLTGTPNPNGYMDLWSQIYLALISSLFPLPFSSLSWLICKKKMNTILEAMFVARSGILKCTQWNRH